MRRSNVFARQIIKQHAARVTSVVQAESHTMYLCGARNVLGVVSVPTSLRKLRLKPPRGRTFFSPHSTDLSWNLAGLDALEALIIEEEEGEQYDIFELSRAGWLGDMHLPALKTLELPAESVAVLDLLHAWARVFRPS